MMATSKIMYCFIYKISTFLSVFVFLSIIQIVIFVNLSLSNIYEKNTIPSLFISIYCFLPFYQIYLELYNVGRSILL